MKARSAKNKGKLLQNLVAEKVRKLLEPLDVNSSDIKSTTMGESGEDVQLSSHARSFLPVSIECKSHARMALYTLYEQAQKEAEGTPNQPVLVVKANRKKPLAVVDLDYWIMLEESRILKERQP